SELKNTLSRFRTNRKVDPASAQKFKDKKTSSIRKVGDHATKRRKPVNSSGTVPLVQTASVAEAKTEAKTEVKKEPEISIALDDNEFGKYGT
ncbi:MAG: hypothetical protein HQK54_13355, partial [Oligoflexales bacterium]|nr:hypothetical protein [Oligoflexales bacterium]